MDNETNRCFKSNGFQLVRFGTLHIATNFVHKINNDHPTNKYALNIDPRNHKTCLFIQ